MSLDLITLVVLVIVSVSGVLTAVWYGRGLPIKYAQRVIVNLDTGNAVEGVLVKHRGTSLTLADVTMHAPDRDPVEIEGTTVIDRARVEFIQTLPSEAKA